MCMQKSDLNFSVETVALVSRSGFHPSTTGQMLTADYLWKQVSANWPDLLGSVNPNNAQITQLFGDQGGY